MVAKTRVINGSWQIEAEAENPGELDKSLSVLAKHGLLPSVKPSAVVLNPAGSSHPKGEKGGAPTHGLDGAASPGFASETLTDPELHHILGKDNASGLWFIRAKLAPGPGGIERVADAALVLLAGYENSGERPTSGMRLLRSLKLTGYSAKRVDRPLEPFRAQGLVMVSGAKKGRGYQLSETGKAQARALVRELATALGGGQK